VVRLRHDGRLDLLIANYVDWSPERNFTARPGTRPCAATAIPTISHGQPPRSSTQWRWHLYRRQQVFRSWCERRQRPGRGHFDYDNDGWQDIFSPTTTCRTTYFTNNRDGTFREFGYARALQSAAKAIQAGMEADRRGHNRQMAELI